MSPEREARGTPALERLVRVAYGDHGQACRVRRFLLGLYNGGKFGFDLTDLRCLDEAIQTDVLAVLAMDMDSRVEVHRRIPGVTDVIVDWAAEDWPE